jgi:hypothetical protein
MDGLEATKAIRKIEARDATAPEGVAARPRTPVIAVTAHAMDEVRETCLAAGMDAFLVKPFDDQQLVELLRKWLPPDKTMEPPPGAVGAAEMVTPAADTGAIDRSAIENLYQMEIHPGCCGSLRNLTHSRLRWPPACAKAWRAVTPRHFGEPPTA